MGKNIEWGRSFYILTINQCLNTQKMGLSVWIKEDIKGDVCVSVLQ